MNQCPPGPQAFPWGRFEFFRKFAETFADKLFSGVNDTGEKFIAGVINSCHRFSVIAGVVDTGDKFITGVVVTGDKFITGVVVTGDKFIAGDNDTSEQLSLVTTTPAIGDKNKDTMEVWSCQG
jgi:hypothetical protein